MVKLKHSILKDTFREIWKTKSRFFSIFGIAAIGVAFFAGVCASAPTMAYNADLYYDEHHLMDIRVLSNFGITAEDIDEIEKIEVLDGVMPAYSADVLVNDGQSLNVMRVHSLNKEQIDSQGSDYLNRLILVEGRLPEKTGEIVVEKTQMLENSFQIGKSILLRPAEGDLKDTFDVTRYKIVGIVQTPYYLSFQKGPSNVGSGTLGFYGYVLEDNFNMDVYTEVFLSVKGADAFNSYEDEYFDYLEDVMDELENLGFKRSKIRRDEIMSDALDQYDEGVKAYEEGKLLFEKEIEAAEQKIKDAEMQLVRGQAELDSQKMLAQLQMNDAQKEIDEGKAQIEEYTKLLEMAEKTYYEMNADSIQSRNETQAKLDEVNAELEVLQTELNEVNQRIDEIDKANSEFAEAQSRVIQLQSEISMSKASIQSLELSLSSPLLDEEQKAEIQAELDAEKQNLVSLEAELKEKEEYIESNQSNSSDERNELLSQQSELNSRILSLQSQAEAYKTALNVLNQSLEPFEALIEEFKTYLKDGQRQVEEGQKQLNDAKALAEKELLAAQKKIDAGYVELEEGKKQLSEEKLKGEEQLREGYEDLVRAKDEIDRIDKAQWYILDRNSHYSYVDYQGAIERMDAIAVIFPVFFFLVAALVCLTTMTRMVDEQRTQIGTMKALGYSNKDIAFKYVFYAAFASLSGCAIGLAFGLTVFPGVIYTAWNMMYILPVIRFTTHISLMIISTVLICSVTTLAAVGACYSELIETPALLMRPKAPKLGKKILLERISWLWNRFSFTSKVTARNIFRYKKRFFMTVIGISGCTALLIAGFGVKDSINAIVDQQFGAVFEYIGTATLNDDIDDERIDQIVIEAKESEILDDVMAVHCASSVLDFESESIDMTLMVVENVNQFKNFVSLHERKTGNEIELDSDGVILTEHMCNQLNISVGDKVNLSNEDGMVRSFEVIGITENYVNHFAYMSESCYQKAFDLRAKDNTLLLVTNQQDQPDDGEVASLLTAYDEVQSVSFYTSIRDNFSSMIQSLDLIVVVIIVSAGALAFVVLFNLTNVNISERVREIATLKVLGFHHKEVNDYVYNENIVLSSIGALAGLVLGKYLHLAIMIMVELDNVMFGRLVKPQSYFMAFVVTLIFTVIVNFVMKKRLREIPMVESLKSVE
ncbi:MAG: ABC transporter permease [Erysipelotrichaceae bacterium]|nr:ABC transporter permease [Erysipelotrichaceae bacterium]